MTPLLRLRGLTKHFPIAGSGRVVQAVNGVSLDIAPGETLGLVGESGSGKTTVGRCILGLTGISAGGIEFEGADLLEARRRDPRSLRGRIQIVFQEPADALDPRLRIAASVEEPLLALGIGAEERRRRVAEAMDLVRLSPHLLRLYPMELSAGQQQRVGIARAMITRPKLLVLDEPTSALDPTARADIIALLMQIQRELNTAYLFISHDLSTVRFVSHRIAVMYLGMIVEQGDAATVFAEPRHPYSAGLLSSVLLPNPHLRRATRISLAGEIPSPIDLPPGCFLASRCPFVVEACRAAMPPAEALGGGHLVHCIRHGEVAKAERAADTFDRFQQEAERILSVGAPAPLAQHG
ncbi:oligopeptide/dipeptide ABC transporter ATP-binding protein [Paracraurococcus lichenis]|uniref:ABC transporter ATP-binding protein n=1 Tax=Paracraurococcus lichenis TaxID=3064888 RepID=A0ABT9E2N1_9PROT|nr:ABC transporter ATP-binding protein [Paracraurococcus sp. LOR1-02]MDO9710403.1 ABC transporter ATP-binding protein [Paracraurococcus sp. LOR1-02]